MRRADVSPGRLQESHGYIEGVGRLRLHYRAWETARPAAALMVLHGLGEHSGRYESLARTMCAYGFSTYALDLRGHGSSEGRRGHARSFEHILQDVDRFRREVQGLIDPETPLFLVGHSMGGLIALRYLEEFEAPFRGAVVISPWLATALPIPRWKSLLASAMTKVLPALPFAAGIQAEDLTSDASIVRAYRDDPLVHDTITPRLFTEISHSMGLAMQRAERIRVPMLLLLAGSDRLVDTERSLAFSRALPRDLVTTRVFPDAYHEILNEVNRASVFAEIRSWITARLGGM